jgi:hypothetical protein
MKKASPDPKVFNSNKLVQSDLSLISDSLFREIALFKFVDILRVN